MNRILPKRLKTNTIYHIFSRNKQNYKIDSIENINMNIVDIPLITEFNITNAIRKLKDKSSLGADRIPN